MVVRYLQMRCPNDTGQRRDEPNVVDDEEKHAHVVLRWKDGREVHGAILHARMRQTELEDEDGG